MNVLFFIGNGFDLNLGLKTSYADFYKYYTKIISKSSAVNRLKNEISGDLKDWSDLELSLGKYTEKIKSVTEFDQVFEDIGNYLS
jgi:abortive infection AbiH-like protein